MRGKEIRKLRPAHILIKHRIYCSTTFGGERIHRDENDSMARPCVFGSASPKTFWKQQIEKEKRIKIKIKERKHVCLRSFLGLFESDVFNIRLRENGGEGKFHRFGIFANRI